MSDEAETVEYDDTGGQARPQDCVPDLLDSQHHSPNPYLPSVRTAER